MKSLKAFATLFFSIAVLIAHAQDFAGGDGTATDPYRVATPVHLNNVRNHLSAHFIQTADIDLSGYSNWVPIAGGGTEDFFTGNYNGQDHKIINLTIDRPATPNVGLFGRLGQGAEANPAVIRNVHLVNVNVKGARGTGSLVGRVTGSIYTLIEGCSASGETGKRSVTGDAAVGGLVGSNNSVHESPGGTNNPVISKSWADIDVSYSRNNSAPAVEKIGGLAGCNQKGTIRDSYARGSVTVNNTGNSWTVSNIGGLVGCILWRGRIERSYATGQVSGQGNIVRIGGLVGNTTTGGNAGVVQDSYWDTQTSGQPTSAGGRGLTTEQMKNQANLFGFDFTNIWKFEPGANHDYAVLREVPLTTYLTWTGTTDTDWEKPGNWNLSRNPAPTDIVVIPSGLTHYPLIDNETPHTPKGISIQQDAKLTIASGGKLTISGFLLNSAGYDGLVIKNGGSLIQSTAGVAATMERNLSTDWHMISSPVSGMTILGSDFAPVNNGTMPSGYNFYFFKESVPFNESLNNWFPWINLRGSGSVPNPNFDVAFVPAKGYMVKYSEAYTQQALSFKGGLNAGNYTYELTYTDTHHSIKGWHIMGNPYPSGYDWNRADKSLLVDDFAYVYNGSQYVPQNEGYLGPNQGFFVLAKQAGTFTFEQAHRAHQGSFTKELQANDELELVLTYGNHSDKTTLRIREEAGFERDRHDALKLYSFSGNMPQLYSFSDDNIKLAVNSLPYVNEEVQITLGVKSPADGQYSLSVTQLGGYFETASIFLHDLLSGSVQKISNNTTISFPARQGDDPARFMLSFSQPATSVSLQEDNEVRIYTWGNTLHLNFTEEAPNRLLQVFDLSGRLVMSHKLSHGLNHTRQLTAEQGVYLVRISSPAGVATQRVFVK